MREKKFDLHAFVAGAALESGEPFQLSCNCGGVVTIMPPFQDEYVICPECESSIRMLVIDGDPGYIVGATPDGDPTLLPVQGSSVPHPDSLPPERKDEMLRSARARMKEEGAKRGDTD